MSNIVLIVEDDESLRRMYEMAFSMHGFQVATASDGVEAIAQIQQQIPTIVLLDLMMPNKDGLTTLKEMKENPATAAIPVIILLNLTSDDYFQEATNLGAVKCIVKSDHEPKDVVQLVNDLLQAPAATPPATPAADPAAAQAAPQAATEPAPAPPDPPAAPTA